MHRGCCNGESVSFCLDLYALTGGTNIQGCDFPDCQRVIQFTTTDNLDAWIQRGGRGGRGGGLCRSTILVQPSVMTQIAKKTGEGAAEDPDPDDEGELGYKIEIKEIFREFLTTKRCLWKVLDEYYQNPEHEGSHLSPMIYLWLILFQNTLAGAATTVSG
jgi:superfamily II DNA helicase RecQ